MITYKKLVALFLALVLTLSCGVFAFAEDGDPAYVWTPIPTSADGLEKGVYYLDLSLDTLDVEDPEEVEAAKAGEWFIDPDRLALKGVYTYHDLECTMLPGFGYTEFTLAMSLNQVGTQWQTVALSKEEAGDGGYYFDKEGAIDVYIGFAGMSDYYAALSADEKAVYRETVWNDTLSEMLADVRSIEVNPGDPLLRYRVSLTEGDETYTQSYPVYEAFSPDSKLYTDMLDAAVKKLPEAEKTSAVARRIAMIKYFFGAFTRFFKYLKKLFKFGK